MNDLFDRYLDDHARLHKKPSTVEQDEVLLRKYLRPYFESRRVGEVVRADIVNWHLSLAQIPDRANRGIALLSKAFNLAEAWGWRDAAWDRSGQRQKRVTNNVRRTGSGHRTSQRIRSN